MRQLLVWLVLMVFSSRVTAQNPTFPERKGQLEFYSTMTIGEPMLVDGPGDFVKGRATLSGNIGIQHRFALPYGIGIGLGGELGILPYNWAYRDVFLDSLFDENEGYYWSAGAEYFSGFTMSIPLSISKRFELADRTRLRISLAALINFHPFTINSGGVGGSAGIGLTDSTEFTYMVSDIVPTSPPYSHSFRPAVGIEFTTKHQNTIGIDALVHLSNHRLNEGFVWDLREQGTLVNYTLSQRINYLGLRFKYGFTYRPEEARAWVLGNEEEVESHRQKVERKPTKYWWTLSAGGMDLREGIEDDRGYHDPDFSPNLRYVLGFEVDDTLNWKVNLSYYNLWVVDGLSKKVLPGSGASGTDPVWNLDGAIGKDLWTSKKGSFKLKPWAGVGVTYLPNNRWTDENDANGWGSMDIVRNDTILYSDTSITYYRNDFNVYGYLALECEWRFLRRMKFSIMPIYAQGLLPIYETEVKYSTPELKDVHAKVWSRGSFGGVMFQLKFPLDVLERKRGGG